MENSIEYLINEVSAILTDTHLNSMQYLLLADALKRAREKHKEEIINSFKAGMDYAEYSIPPNWKNEWDEYYNQTYNQNK
jgi:hypothetical protein